MVAFITTPTGAEMINVDFATPVDMAAGESGWVLIHGETAQSIYAKGNVELIVEYTTAGLIKRTRKRVYDDTDDVAHTYLHGRLGAARTLNTQSLEHSKPAELLGLTLRMLQGSF
jgi:hypothetical protein